MAYKQAELYYWDGSKWVLAVTHNGVNALMGVRILEMMGNPVKLGATLTNFAKDWTSAVAADQRGFLTNVFKDYMEILVREGETHQILFAGRIYKIDTSYDPQMGGSTIQLEAFDALAELRDFSTAGLDEAVYRHFKMASLGGGTTRSDVVQELIKDSIGTSTSNWITNSGSNINVTDYAGTSPRFTNSATAVAADDYIEPSKTGHTSILDEISRLAASDPHTSADGDKDMGYNYYVDHNMTVPKPTSGNWTSNPPAHLNYYKRGTRPTTTPATNGLTVKFGTGAKNQTALPENTTNDTYLNNQKAQKIMLASYEFNKPSEEMFSHAIVTYSSQDQEKDKEHNLVTQFMEVLYVSSIANFKNASNDMFFEKRDLFNHVNKPKSFRNPPALLQYKNASDVWTDTGAYVHMTTAATSGSVSGGSTVRDYEAILVGYSDDYAATWEYSVTQMQAIGTAVELRLQLWLESSSTDGGGNVTNTSVFANPSGGTPVQGFTTNPTCTFDASTITIGKGRAKTAYGVNRPKRINIANITGTETLRTSIMSNLYRMNMDLRRGKFTVTGPPYYAFDVEVRTSSSNNLTFRNISDGTAALDLTDFNIRDGFTIMNFGTDQTFSDSSEVSHGQISAVTSTTQVTVAMNDSTAPSVGHYVRIYVPLRAGDFIRIENAQEAIVGNHFITTIDYGERSGNVQTTLSTVGRNEDVALTSSEGISHEALDIRIQRYSGNAGFGFTANTVPYGQRPFELRGVTFARTDRDTVSWTIHPEGAYIKIGGRWYSVVAGNSGNLSTTIPTGKTTCPEYYIYWDPDVSLSALQIAPIGDGISAGDYIPDGDNVIIGVCRANVNAAKKAEFWLYGKSPGSLFELDFYKDDPGAFIEDNAMTAALQRKGIQPFTSNIVFEPASGGSDSHPTGHHTISILGKAANGAEASGTARVVEFTDTKTATMNVSITSLAVSAGENTGTGSVIWYIYFDLSTGSESSGNYTGVSILATTDYSLVNTDERGLLAIAAVSTDYTQKVAIQTFGSKIGNINADNIAANSITANAISAATVSTIQAGTSASDVGLSSFSGQTVTGIQEGVTPVHVSDNMTGVTMTTTGNIFSGSKTTYGSTTEGWWIGFDSGTPKINIGSGTSRLRWTGTTLEVVGQITLSDGTAESAIKNVNTTASNVGLGSVDNHSTASVLDGTRGDFTGDLNGLPITTQSNNNPRIVFASDGITGFHSSGTANSNKNFHLSATGGSTPFTVYGQLGSQSGTNATSSDVTRGIEFINSNGYLAAISPVSANSELRYDASTHSFMNFSQGGYIDDVYELILRPSGGGGQASGNFEVGSGTNYHLRINVPGSSSNVDIKSVYGNIDIKPGTSSVGNDRINLHAYRSGGDVIYVYIAGLSDVKPEGMHQQNGNYYSRNIYPDEYSGGSDTGGDSLYNIGATTSRYANGYFDNVTGADLILDNITAGEANDIDGTRGHWVIQEGEDNLYIKNKISGKKYKFTLEEI